MPCLKPPKREGECAPSVRKGRCWVALHWAGTARATSPLDGDATDQEVREFYIPNGTDDFPARQECPNLHHRTGRDEASHPSAKASRRRKAKRQRMARFARWCLRGAIPAAGSHAGIRESTWRTGSSGHKKSAAPKNGALPRTTTGVNQIRPES